MSDLSVRLLQQHPMPPSRASASTRPPRQAPVHAESGPRDGTSLGAAARILSSLSPESQAAIHSLLQDGAERTGDPMSVLDRALNLNEGGFASLISGLDSLSAEEADEVLQSLVNLLKHGVVGYEIRKVNGAPHRVFIDAAIGSDLHRAPLVRSGSVKVLV